MACSGAMGRERSFEGQREEGGMVGDMVLGCGWTQGRSAGAGQVVPRARVGVYIDM